jgi:hypothetical protein
MRRGLKMTMDDGFHMPRLRKFRMGNLALVWIGMIGRVRQLVLKNAPSTGGRGIGKTLKLDASAHLIL